MDKYRIRGLDCAQCANEIENELKKIPGLESTRLSFATETILLEAKHERTAQEIIDRIEPGVTISPFKAVPAAANEEKGNNKGTITRIAVAALLFIVGSVFNRKLHESPYAVAEYGVLLLAYLLVGAPVLLSAFKSIVRGKVFNEMFLMSIATIGAVIIHQLPEAVGVMLFYSVGEFLQDRAVEKSRRSIASLMDLRPDSARLLEGD